MIKQICITDRTHTALKLYCVKKKLRLLDVADQIINGYLQSQRRNTAPDILPVVTKSKDNKPTATADEIDSGN